MEKNLTQKSLFEKIQSVANEIKNISKDMTVGSGSYSYKAVSDLQVTLAVKEAETKFKLISIPVKQELVSSDTLKIVRKDGSEAITYVDNIKMTIRIQDLESEQFIEIESYGKGIDAADKGFGKASTYARKYGLLNAYKIATGEDPEANKSEEQTTPKTISEKSQAVQSYLETDIDRKTKVIEHFNAAEFRDLTEEQINIIYSGYKKKGLI
jgi:hypothetical protein